MMKVNRFMKVDLRASSALAYGTLVLYALVLASLLERLAAVRDARVLASWRRAYIQIQDMEGETRGVPNFYLVTAL
ncbi:MAG: hypothetical protein DME44_12455 [Verrucomicrobia bacterium]|nr:MAG: hypothetical protein DME44_12455 [Verrucomicrobiota bacterium]